MSELQPGMFVVHRKSGYLGMIMVISGNRAAMQNVQNGPWKRANLSMLRPAFKDEIEDAALDGVGCVPPPERNTRNPARMSIAARL